MEIQKLIGARIKELRKELGETQEEMAARAGIDKTYWNEVENGKRNVAVVNLGKIIVALETTFAQFFKTISFDKGNEKIGGKRKSMIKAVKSK